MRLPLHLSQKLADVGVLGASEQKTTIRFLQGLFFRSMTGFLGDLIEGKFEFLQPFTG